jgi:hypothetical protein
MRFNSHDIASIYFRELRAGRPLYERFQTAELRKIQQTIEEIRKTQKLKRATKRRYGLDKAQQRRDAKQRYERTIQTLNRRTQRLKKELDSSTNKFIEVQHHAVNMLTNDQIFEFDYTVINFVDKNGKQREGARRSTKNLNQYLATKILIQNIKNKTLKVSLSRDQLVEGLISTLDSQIPMTLVKTDVQAFYPSLKHAEIEELISRSPLTETEKGLLARSTAKYGTTVNKRFGIPQGDPVSALLGEMVGQQIEQLIESIDDTIYVARFVDDFVFVLAGLHKSSEIMQQLRTIGKQQNVKFGRSKTCLLFVNDMNNDRTDCTDSPDIAVTGKFDFLGYSIEIAPNSNGSTAKIELRRETFDKAKQKIFDAFDSFDQSLQRSGDLGRLTETLRWLIYNSRLNNAKSHVLTGIYFNYRHLQPLNQLKTLDHLIVTNLQKREQKIKTAINENLKLPNKDSPDDRFSKVERKFLYLKNELSFERSYESKLITRSHKSKKRR